MFLNTRSHRFLSRPLMMAFAAACGVLLSTAAQAQMVTGSGCTNCGGAGASVVTYSQPATAQYGQPVTAQYSQPMTTQYSQPMMQQNYPASGVVSHSYPSSSCSGCTSTRRHCSPHRAARAVACYRQPSSPCGTTYSNASVVSGGGCCSGSGSYLGATSYPSSGVSNVSHFSPTVMQTGAGCAGGNCH